MFSFLISIMRQFNIIAKNKVGCLADIIELVAKENINLKSIITEGEEGHAKIKIITDNEDITRKLLKQNNINFHEHEIVPARILDKPGELAKLSRAISNLNIDIKSVHLLDRDKGTVHIAFRVNDLEKAKELLK